MNYYAQCNMWIFKLNTRYFSDFLAHSDLIFMGKFCRRILVGAVIILKISPIEIKRVGKVSIQFRIRGDIF